MVETALIKLEHIKVQVVEVDTMAEEDLPILVCSKHQQQEDQATYQDTRAVHQ